MKSDLSLSEQQYVDRILDILKSSGVSPAYCEDAKVQLIEHIREARLNKEDFEKDLGSPEDFALHFMESATTADETLNKRQTADPSRVKKLSLKTPFVFVVIAGLIYLGLQFLTVLIFTPALSPYEDSAFHLFRISDYLWWNLLAIGINALLALIISALAMKLISRRYRFS